MILTRHGLFNAVCTAYEIVMPDGSIIWCNKDNHQKLYLSIPFSYGTLGFLTAIDIKIVPYRPYVKHTYMPVSSVEEAVQVLNREINNPDADTVEGIMFSKDEGVIMRGTFEEELKVCSEICNIVFTQKTATFYCDILIHYKENGTHLLG